MDFVVCNRSSTESSSALAKFARSCAVQPGADLTRRDEDRVVELFGQFRHAVLLGKLPDIPQNINDPIRLRHRALGVSEFRMRVDSTCPWGVKLTNIGPPEMVGVARANMLIPLKLH